MLQDPEEEIAVSKMDISTGDPPSEEPAPKAEPEAEATEVGGGVRVVGQVWGRLSRHWRTLIPLHKGLCIYDTEHDAIGYHLIFYSCKFK